MAGVHFYLSPLTVLLVVENKPVGSTAAASKDVCVFSLPYLYLHLLLINFVF